MLLAHERDGLRDLRRLPACEHRERAECLPLDLVDLSMQDVEIELVAANRLRQDRLIDAIGGVKLTVPQDVVFGKYNEGLVKAGTRKLGGADAMWFARSRTNSDDYTRMGRQRCVLGALLAKSDQATVLVRFNQVALAAKELFKTDIPRSMLEHLVPLALKVKSAKVTSVPFVPPLINTGYPDWNKAKVGYICLQDHGAPVYFRNIKVHTL